LNLLFLADVVGPAGRRAVEENLQQLRERYDADLAIVNGENIADGVGITPKLADKLLAAGADVVTLGNHTYRRGGIGGYLAASERVIRPANQGALTPGNAMAVVEARNGVRVAVLNAGLAVGDGRRARRRSARGGAGRLPRLPRGSDERKGCDGDVARRACHCSRGHAHARADERRTRPVRRDGGDHGRRHDRAARLRHRREVRPRYLSDA
jgi:hypothetical protein